MLNIAYLHKGKKMNTMEKSAKVGKEQFIWICLDSLNQFNIS